MTEASYTQTDDDGRPLFRVHFPTDEVGTITMPGFEVLWDADDVQFVVERPSDPRVRVEPLDARVRIADEDAARDDDGRPLPGDLGPLGGM